MVRNQTLKRAANLISIGADLGSGRAEGGACVVADFPPLVQHPLDLRGKRAKQVGVLNPPMETRYALLVFFKKLRGLRRDVQEGEYLEKLARLENASPVANIFQPGGRVFKRGEREFFSHPHEIEGFVRFVQPNAHKGRLGSGPKNQSRRLPRGRLTARG
jgi:hypothetical protein